MDLEIRWHSPLPLLDGSRDDVFFTCDFERLPTTAGVYVFARRHGNRIAPLYIGRTTSIRTRIAQHLYNNVPLVRRILEAKNGARVILAGEWISRRGQQANRALPLIEQALIDHALAQGHTLFNDKGTKTLVHSLTSTGNRETVMSAFSKTIYRPAK